MAIWVVGVARFTLTCLLLGILGFMVERFAFDRIERFLDARCPDGYRMDRGVVSFQEIL